MADIPRTADLVAHPDELTERQRQILALLASGKADKAIARELGLAPQTVKNQISQLYRRLPLGEVGSPRPAAVAWYLRLVPPPRD